MALNLIGVGFCDEKDITVKGLELVRKCEKIYLEDYTSLLQCSVTELETFYGKPIILADREMSEQGAEKLVEEAKTTDVAFLVVGDPLAATTHISLLNLAREKNVPVQVIHNASILTAVGEVGLELYKYGKTTSIPFDNPNLQTPQKVIIDNQSLGLHTLCLLDLKPKEGRFMTIKEALDILKLHQKVIGCARLGCENSMIKYGLSGELKDFDFGKPPFCLIVPGKLHFVEEESLSLY
jgi:diphthine methyl ester synthase